MRFIKATKERKEKRASLLPQTFYLFSFAALLKRKF